jgi:hypothetical protein
VAISLAIIASVVPSFATAAPVAGSSCTNTLRITDDGTREDSWSGVSAISSTDAWAVGDVFGSHGGNHEIIGHWDGTAWRHSRPPEIRNQVEPRSVAAISATDVWAIGTIRPYHHHERIAAYHWDGSVWSQTPTTRTFRSMWDVTSAGPDDVWMVGISYHADGYYPRTMHWDGTSWTTVPNPLRRERWTGLTSVDAAGPDDVWAVGYNNTEPVAMRWDGNRWTTQPVPGSLGKRPGLFGVVTISASDAWAVGQDDNGERALLEHWNGTSWMRRTPAAASGFSAAFKVSAASPSDVWVIVNDGTQDALMHFDGASWSVDALPGAHDAAFLRDVTSLPAGQMFAVGGTGTGLTYAVDRCVA